MSTINISSNNEQNVLGFHVGSEIWSIGKKTLNWLKLMYILNQLLFHIIPNKK